MKNVYKAKLTKVLLLWVVVPIAIAFINWQVSGDGSIELLLPLGAILLAALIWEVFVTGLPMKIVFDDEKMVFGNWFKKHTIGYKDVKDYSLSSFSCELYFIDNRRPKRVSVIYFSKKHREEIDNCIKNFMLRKFMDMTEDELNNLYSDSK